MTTLAAPLTALTSPVFAPDLMRGDILASGVRVVDVSDDGPAGIWLVTSDGDEGYVDRRDRFHVYDAGE